MNFREKPSQLSKLPNRPGHSEATDSKPMIPIEFRQLGIVKLSKSKAGSTQKMLFPKAIHQKLTSSQVHLFI